MVPQIDKSKLFGLLHEMDGSPVQRQVRILKVGIGVPVGPDVHVWIDANDKWCVEVGQYEGKKRTATVKRLDDRESAAKYYLDIRKTAPTRLYPRKLPYFTFLRMGMGGNYLHDFDAIEQHGSLPTEVEIVFLSNSPFDAAYQLFTAAEMKCEGNGLDARRRTTFAQSDEEKVLAAEAENDGERFFAIISGCATKGCPFVKGDRPACKPHGRLYFQLTNSPRIGGTCTFDTTGKRSLLQIQSCIEQIKTVTGRGNPNVGLIAGIPLQFVVRPYKTSHNGQPSIQYGVSLEFRAANAVQLAQLLHLHAAGYQDALQAPPLQIGVGDEAVLSEPTGELEDQVIAGAAEALTHTGELEDDPTDAAALEAEFYTEGPDDEDEGNGLEENVPDQIQMPQRISVATTVQSELEHNLETADDDTPKPRVIDGVTFPIQLKATNEKQKASVDLLTVLQDEATRAGVNLYQYVWGEFAAKPDELTTAAVKALTEVLAKKPDAKKRK